MRGWIAVILMVALGHAEFVLREAEVRISDIRPDGGVHVREAIRFLVIGDYAKALYESGFDRNDLSFWSNATGLRDVTLHLNPNKVNIPPSEFALRPQPLRGCNAALDLCQGELVLEYNAYPYYNQSLHTPLPGTGVFSVQLPKPRTRYYAINAPSLAFTPTSQGDFRLEQEVYLKLNLPPGAWVEREEDLNPKPNDLEKAEFPLSVRDLKWNNIVLVKFNVAFTVEDSLDKEVVEFFAGIFRVLEQQARGEQGAAIVLILLVILGGYLYLQRVKRKGV